VEVDVGIDARTQPLHKRDGAALGVPNPVLVPGPAAERSEYGAGKDLKNIPDQGLIVGQPVAQGEWDRQDPLAHGDFGNDAIDQVRGGVGHPPPRAGRTEAPPAARKRDEPVGATPVAVNPKKAVSQDSAL
jgi:hypothetical protein